MGYEENEQRIKEQMVRQDAWIDGLRYIWEQFQEAPGTVGASLTSIRNERQQMLDQQRHMADDIRRLQDRIDFLQVEKAAAETRGTMYAERLEPGASGETVTDAINLLVGNGYAAGAHRLVALLAQGRATAEGMRDLAVGNHMAQYVQALRNLTNTMVQVDGEVHRLADTLNSERLR